MEHILSYQYDVSLSYKRSDDWARYVDNHFFPKLRFWLGAELGHPARIFFDAQDVETGASWPYKLADGLAHSRTMVCLWSKEYFNSDWCKEELTQMLARRKSLTGPNGPPPLILAVIIHDSEDLNQSLKDIQRFDLHKYCNPWMTDGSPAAEQLSVEIARLARDVANAVEQSPGHDE